MKKTNRLIHEKSPYLLQHARNPVDWYPWGDEAFAKARNEDRPILLSIGYATCHWCHVMERESFEDQSTADLLNEHFVAIKVDREELPDVDSVYMRALHAMGQPGGWPLNLILTPELQPITGGTYFPPQPAYGRPSFKQFLTMVAQLWKKDRRRLLDVASSITEFLSEENAPASELPDISIFDRFIVEMQRAFDEERGGFNGNGQNKFPPSMALLLLLRLYERHREKLSSALVMVEKTLQAMSYGGIYDQIGGGLCRYATDLAWKVPHFEKMLYDNALFLQALTETYRITGNDFYRWMACDVIAYLHRDLRSPEGAFYCAEDADSEGEEGKFYVWSAEEFRRVLRSSGLSDEEIRLLSLYWNVTESGNFEGRNILHRRLSDEEFASRHSLSLKSLKELIQRGRTALFQNREKRIRPLRDDKILTSWNALIISALCRASAVFKDSSLAAMAEDCAQFLCRHLMQDGRLLRRYRDGEARFPATLTDHALFGCSLIDLFRVTGKSRYMQEAVHRAEAIRSSFFTDGRLYETAEEDAKDLFIRPVDSYDGVMPSGPSAALRLFVTLSRYGENPHIYDETANAILRQFSPDWTQSARAYPAMLSAFLTFSERPLEIAVTGNSDFVQKSLHLIGSRMDADAIYAFHIDEESDAEDSASSVPLLAGKDLRKSAIYLCENFACREPFTSPSQLEQALA